jgi:hypothetical protein
MFSTHRVTHATAVQSSRCLTGGGDIVGHSDQVANLCWQTCAEKIAKQEKKRERARDAQAAKRDKITQRIMPERKKKGAAFERITLCC